MAVLVATVLAPMAYGEASIFELRITNDTNSDLTFKLQDGHSKHVHLTYDKTRVTSHTIEAGTSGVVGVQPNGDKCDPGCGACSPSYGKVYAWYTNDSGNEVRNNYYRATVEFSEYCGVAGNKPITTYTSNWAFDHGGGQGTKHFHHEEKSSHNSYTTSNPAQGLTVDAKHISGHATITYSER
jgi:hypothetical protein